MKLRIKNNMPDEIEKRVARLERLVDTIPGLNRRIAALEAANTAQLIEPPHAKKIEVDAYEIEGAPV